MALMSRGTAVCSYFSTPTAPPRPRRCILPFRAAAFPAALDRRRRPQNVAGDFFVDQRCIDCQTCRWMAPVRRQLNVSHPILESLAWLTTIPRVPACVKEVFKRVDGKAAVAAQPSSEEERTKALQALLSCPTSSIHTEKPPQDILRVQNMFPLPIDNKLLPGVYLCGYNSEDSYGATSYLVIHPQGNILIDRY